MPTDILPPSSAPTNVGLEDGALLTITVNGTTRAVDPPWLADKTEAAAIEVWCGTAVEPVVITLRAFPSWPASCQDGLHSLVKQLISYVVRIEGQAGSYPDLFAALVAAIAPPNDGEAHQSTLKTAIQAAASFFHGVARTAAATAIRDRLRELGISGARVPTLVKEICNDYGPFPGITLENPTLTAGNYVHYLGGGGPIEYSDEYVAEPPHLRYFRDQFWTWNGHRWMPMSEARLKARVVAYLCNRAPESKHTDRFARDVITNLKGQVNLDCWEESPPFRIKSEQPLLTERAHILALQNGVLDFDGFSNQPAGLGPHSPRLFNTSVIPYDYDPEARCPLWSETLSTILPPINDSDHRIDVLQEVFGYGLLSDCRFQKFVILHGTGSNGKSTIMSVLESMLGRDNVSHVALEHFGTEFHLAQMDGKLANLSSDMTHVDIAAEGVLKQLVSGERVQVNIKYKDPFPMRSTAKLVFGTNELPTVTDRSDGVWRRVIAMPFHVRFVHRSTGLYCQPQDVPVCAVQEADPEREAALMQELPGILNWALAGLRRLLHQGGFTHCGVCAASLAEHRRQSDPFLLFVDECLAVVPGGRANISQAYDLYSTFCKRHGARPLGLPKFGGRMTNLSGVRRDRDGHGSRSYYYDGVNLSNDALSRYISQAPLC